MARDEFLDSLNKETPNWWTSLATFHFGDAFNSLFGDTTGQEQARANTRLQYQGYQDEKEFQKRFENTQNEFQNRFENDYGVGRNVKDPSALIDQITENYKPSKYQQFISDQANQGLRNQLNSTGLAGSSYGLGQAAQLNSSLAGAGLNDYIQQALGVYNQSTNAWLQNTNSFMQNRLNSRQGGLQALQGINNANNIYQGNRNNSWKQIWSGIEGLGKGLGEGVGGGAGSIR